MEFKRLKIFWNYLYLNIYFIGICFITYDSIYTFYLVKIYTPEGESSLFEIGWDNGFSIDILYFTFFWNKFLKWVDDKTYNLERTDNWKDDWLFWLANKLLK